jgi:hypothetical protein
VRRSARAKNPPIFNLKTARLRGLEVPTAVLARAALM